MLNLKEVTYSISDMEEIVKKAIPNLSTEKTAELLSVLESIGVCSSEDLSFVKEEDLQCLTRIEARKALAYWRGNKMSRVQVYSL